MYMLRVSMQSHVQPLYPCCSILKQGKEGGGAAAARLLEQRG